MEIKRIFVAFVVMIFLLASGTIFFHTIEQWTWVDSFYFAGSTITTVGFGDFVPTNDLSKIGLVIYSILAVGLYFYYIAVIVAGILHHVGLEEHLGTVLQHPAKVRDKISAYKNGKEKED
jgi:voltage-gated potassium channel